MPALLWLTTTIEELGQCNEDCTIKRCQLLKSMLNQHVPHIVQIIQIFLKKEQNEMKGKFILLLIERSSFYFRSKTTNIEMFRSFDQSFVYSSIIIRFNR